MNDATFPREHLNLSFGITSTPVCGLRCSSQSPSPAPAGSSLSENGLPLFMLPTEVSLHTNATEMAAGAPLQRIRWSKNQAIASEALHYVCLIDAVASALVDNWYELRRHMHTRLYISYADGDVASIQGDGSLVLCTLC
ncbi:hypothetical protein E4U26_003782, partial [Claviceps purpurea]